MGQPSIFHPSLSGFRADSTSRSRSARWRCRESPCRIGPDIQQRLHPASSPSLSCNTRRRDYRFALPGQQPAGGWSCTSTPYCHVLRRPCCVRRARSRRVFRRASAPARQTVLPFLAVPMRDDRFPPGRSTIFRKGKIDVIGFGIRVRRDQPVRSQRSVGHHGSSTENRPHSQTSWIRAQSSSAPTMPAMQCRKIRYAAFSLLARLQPGHENAAVRAGCQIRFGAAGTGRRFDVNNAGGNWYCR